MTSVNLMIGETRLHVLGTGLLEVSESLLFAGPAGSKPLLPISGLMMIIILLALYTTCWVLHFVILRNSGPGNDWMSREFLSTLQGTNIVLGPGIATLVINRWASNSDKSCVLDFPVTSTTR